MDRRSLSHLSRLLNHPEGSSWPLLFEKMIGQCQKRPFVWLIDDFDRLPTLRHDTMATALEIIRCGGHVMLGGRMPPEQLWPANGYVQSRLTDVALHDWHPIVAAAFLRGRDVVAPEMLDLAVRMAQGRPKTLGITCRWTGYIGSGR